MVIKNENERHQFNADYRVAWLSVLGLLGFVIGCVILFGSDIFVAKENTVFHEIEYNPRSIADSLLKRPIDSLRGVINNRQQRLGLSETNTKATEGGKPGSKRAMTKMEEEMTRKKASGIAKKDNTDTLAILQQEQETDLAVLKKLSGYLIATNGLNPADASGFGQLNKVLHFEITPERLSAWQKRYNTGPTKWKETAAVSFKDAEVPFPVTGETTFSMSKPYSDIAFIAKYPATGTWLLLIMIFTSFCFVAVSTCIVLSRRLVRLLTDNQITNANPFAYTLCVVIVTIVVFLLTGLWGVSFYDEEVIKNLLFMSSLSRAMWWTTIIGYIAGGFCLAGFIYTAGSLGFIRDNLESIRQLAGTNSVSDEEKKRQATIYLNLRKYFNTYFFLSSVILSVLVLCTGGLYTVVNSLDFVKLLSDDWGYSPARSEFVFLYGGLHTVVLLLVYIPAKMRFSEMMIEDTGKPLQDGDKKWYEIVKNPFGQLKEVLVAVSPLLASLLQSLFDILFS